MTNKSKLQIEKEEEYKVDYSKYNFPIDSSKIPETFLEQFKVKNPEFRVDEFEELILQDVMRFDENTRIKLSRDMTETFSNWMKNKIEKKENISLNVKGGTRSGKSVVTLKFTNNNVRYYNKPFDTNYIVCANQKEYRLKLNKAKFGDVFQIDENAFANVGEGSMTETHQLKDIQNIIAKQNIHTYYITPKVFLLNNAELGLSYWGKDVNNWCSRFLLYSLKNQNPILLGYVVINVGTLFNEYGCFFNKLLGGCTNPNRLRLKELTKEQLIFDDEKDLNNIKQLKFSRDYLKYSSCIPKHKTLKSIDELELNDIDKEKTPCPFYRICKHPMRNYEIKKDKWIDKEMSGGMDERSLERFRVALELIKKLGFYDLQNNRFMIKAKGKADLKIKTDLYMPKISNTKFTGTEKETIISTIQSLSDVEIFEDVCKNLNLNYIKQLKQIEGTDDLVRVLTNKSKPDKDELKKTREEKLFRKKILDILKDEALSENELNSSLKEIINKIE